MENRIIILILILYSIFNVLYTAEYPIPRAAYSVYSDDLDLDGYNDIIIGHKTMWGDSNTTISILYNRNDGTFITIDTSIVFSGYQENIFSKKVDNNIYPDIVSFFSDFSSGSPDRYIRIFYNDYGYFNYFLDFSLNNIETFSNIIYGDIDNDNDTDIIVASHNGQFWGVLYSDGTGQLSTPQYYNLDYHPGDIACGDLNNDGRDDIAICGLKLEIYISHPNNFQKILIDEPHYMGNVKIADMNNDGYNDLITETWYVPGSDKDISIYFNNGQLNFNYVYVRSITEAASELFIADLNNDNFPDVIYNVSYYYPNSLYETYHTYILFNNGDRTLQAPVHYQTYYGDSIGYVQSIKSFAADLDINNYNDIITVNYSYNESSVHILYNDGTGQFIEDPPNGMPPNGNQIISDFELYQNYPNPFNNETIISYYLKNPTFIELTIHNINGELVKIYKLPPTTVGLQKIYWDGTNSEGKGVSSGVYVYTLRVKGNNISKKMLLVR